MTALFATESTIRDASVTGCPGCGCWSTTVLGSALEATRATSDGFRPWRASAASAPASGMPITWGIRLGLGLGGGAGGGTGGNGRNG